MGTSASFSGGTGGTWTRFKRAASAFAQHGGDERLGRVLASYVAAMGGAASTTAAAGTGIRVAQSLASFLAGSAGPAGIAGGLQAVGLGHLIGADRFTILTALLDRFAGAGNDLEVQAARDALLDILDAVLPDDDAAPLEEQRLNEREVTDLLQHYLAALIYNRAIPIIDERLTRLQNPDLAQQRDGELREYIEALVRLETHDLAPLTTDWQGATGRALLHRMVQAAYAQIEAWE